MRRFSITIKTLICQLGPFIIPDWELRLRLRLKRELHRAGKGGQGETGESVARHTADELKSHEEVSGSYKKNFYKYLVSSRCA